MSSNTREQIKWKLQIIFIYYSSYADRNNFKLLKQQNYRRFLIDSETIKTQSSLVYFDIAFQKISNTAIIFKDFLELIPTIAQILFKGLGRNQAFNHYLHRHIQPLFLEIIEKSQFGLDIHVALNATIDQKILRKLQKILITQRAYNQYIVPSTYGKQIIQIFQSLTNFLKDFQVCPHLVSKSLVYVLFLSIMKQKIQSQTFSLQDFSKILIIIAQISNKKLTINTIQLSPIAKIIKLLQRMEISSGFDKISKKIMYQTAISPSFLKSFNQHLRTNTDDSLQKLDKNISRMYPSSIRHKNCNDSFQQYSLTKKQKKQQLKAQNYQTIQHLLIQQNPNLSQQFKYIKQTFQQLCQYGEVANNKTLKSIKIKKLFQRIGLTQMIGQAWLDIQIVNLQRSSNTGKIEFLQFLELLSAVSNKIGITFQQIVNLIINDKEVNSRISGQRSHAIHKNSYTNQQQRLLKQIMQACQKQLLKVYKKYNADNSLLGFNQFIKLMYDFEIFPTIVSKNKLYQIFSSLHDIREYSPQNSQKNKIKKAKDVQNYLKNNKKIDFNGFLMALIEVGQEICDLNLQATQKLLILLQKINQSQGYKKIINLSLVQTIRKKFAKYYINNFYHKKQHVQDFDQLLNTFQ